MVSTKPGELQLEDERPSVVDVTYDGTTMRLFVDGVLAGTEVASTGNLPMSTYPLLLGPTTVESRLSAPYDGTLDEASLYSTALTPTRVAAHASAAELETSNLGPTGEVGITQYFDTLGDPNDDSSFTGPTTNARARASGLGDRYIAFEGVFDSFHITKDRLGRRVLSIHAGWRINDFEAREEYSGLKARLILVIERKVGDSPWQPVGDIEPETVKQASGKLGSSRRATSKVEIVNTPGHLSSYRGRLDIDLIGENDPPGYDYSSDKPLLPETPARFLG